MCRGQQQTHRFLTDCHLGGLLARSLSLLLTHDQPSSHEATQLLGQTPQPRTVHLCMSMYRTIVSMIYLNHLHGSSFSIFSLLGLSSSKTLITHRESLRNQHSSLMWLVLSKRNKKLKKHQQNYQLPHFLLLDVFSYN